MEKLSKDKVRAIGVSNFNIDKLEKLAKTQKVVPAVNQVSKNKNDVMASMSDFNFLSG